MTVTLILTLPLSRSLRSSLLNLNHDQHLQLLHESAPYRCPVSDSFSKIFDVSFPTLMTSCKLSKLSVFYYYPTVLRVAAMQKGQEKLLETNKVWENASHLSIEESCSRRHFVIRPSLLLRTHLLFGISLNLSPFSVFRLSRLPPPPLHSTLLCHCRKSSQTRQYRKRWADAIPNPSHSLLSLITVLSIYLLLSGPLFPRITVQTIKRSAKLVKDTSFPIFPLSSPPLPLLFHHLPLLLS